MLFVTIVMGIDHVKYPLGSHDLYLKGKYKPRI